jgi:hypothetical protein
MDTGAQQDASDTGAPSSGAGTTEDASAGTKSAGIDKGKAPEVPEIRADLAPASAGQATPAVPKQPAPKTPAPKKAPTPTKATAPAKTTVPDKTTAPVKSGTLKIERIIKSGTQSAATAPAKAASRPSSALALHFGKAAARPSFFDTPELKVCVSLLSKSDKSLGSLKEHFIKWNDADTMDTTESKNKKAAEASATGDPTDILAAKPIPIACELLNIQQRLHLLADATNISLFYIYPQSPKILAVWDTDIWDFPIPFVASYFQINYPTYELEGRASNPSHRGSG